MCELLFTFRLCTSAHQPNNNLTKQKSSRIVTPTDHIVVHGSKAQPACTPEKAVNKSDVTKFNLKEDSLYTQWEVHCDPLANTQNKVSPSPMIPTIFSRHYHCMHHAYTSIGTSNNNSYCQLYTTSMIELL